MVDFGIRWFDFVQDIAGARVQSVFATVTHALGQRATAPLVSQVLIRMDGGQASRVFDGATAHGARDTICIFRHQGQSLL